MQNFPHADKMHEASVELDKDLYWLGSWTEIVDVFSEIDSDHLKILWLLTIIDQSKLEIPFAASITPPSNQRVCLLHIEGEVSGVSETGRRCFRHHLEILPVQLVIAECYVAEEHVSAHLVDGQDGGPGLAMYGQHAAAWRESALIIGTLKPVSCS
jgi:hypothetical protein